MSNLILASASPRRRELLGRIGLQFDVRPSRIDEERYRDLPPGPRVEALALAKARAVAARVADALVLGADTLVVCQGQVLGKPDSPADAAAMLTFLSGRIHNVYTGVAVVRAPGVEARVTHARTAVTFRRLTPDQIAAYVATGEPLDKAGAYGIQGRGALLVAGIQGDYFNVVGLPLIKVEELLAAFGVDVWGRL
ncbi:Maf family protein [Moorella sp. Hama-1]|uniref:Maf family protein n=1 Tax=Moorella sp. Hama-1 TaxID=2138101 RepID=UPI000D644187|nr:Maf family protein [Moorella sp. Hama-1]BCV20453.1 Maf-like protein [Moorella sp. Hama-1]